MTSEQLFFLNILSDFLNRKSTSRPSNDFDWRSILYFAQIHQVEGIVYSQCKSFLPDEINKFLQEKYCATMHSYANRDYFEKKLKGELKAENIEFFFIKGLTVACYYPLPALRTMSDTDIVVHSEERVRVHEILLRLGYINVSMKKNREWIYYKQNYELELHDRLIYDSPTNRRVYDEFLMEFWNHVHNGCFDWNHHLIFLLLHLRKHLMTSGVGFRQFMDIAALAANNADLDWNWISNQLVYLGLIEFAKIVFALNKAWFGVSSPIEINELNNAFFERATEYIFINGVFGFDNDDNKTNLVINRVRKSKNAKFSMFIAAVHSLFPSYSAMVSVPMYSFLNGKKWLLPLAWIYRIFKGTNRSSFSDNMSTVKSSFVSKETIETREDWLKQWRLDEID